MAGMMFPWERAVLSGERTDGPMTNMQKFYWVAFAAAVAFLVVNRVNIYYKNLKTKEELADELAENRRAMQEALEGRSFITKEDPFEGMEPDEIEAFLKKQAPDGDPYAGKESSTHTSSTHNQSHIHPSTSTHLRSHPSTIHHRRRARQAHNSSVLHRPVTTVYSESPHTFTSA